MRRLAGVSLILAVILKGELAHCENLQTPAHGPDASLIIARLIERSHAAKDSVAPHLCCCRHTVLEEFDDHGRLKTAHTKDYSVDFREGSERTSLQKVDDRPPTTKEIKADRKEHPDQPPKDKIRNKRSKKSEPDEIDDRLINHFHYELLGTDSVGGRPAFRLSFEPRADDADLPKDEQVVGLMRGTAWIDASDYELVKVDARLGEPIEMLGGILGSLRKLSVDIERRRISTDCWENSTIDTRFEIRKLLSVTRGHLEIRQDKFEVIAN